MNTDFDALIMKWLLHLGEGVMLNIMTLVVFRP